MDCATRLIQACVELGNWRFPQTRGPSVLIKELAEASDDGRFWFSKVTFITNPTVHALADYLIEPRQACG